MPTKATKTDTGKLRGTLEIDVTVRHVGRIKKATGAPRTSQGRQTAKRMREMVRNLAGMGRHDLLVRIRDGELPLPIVWSHYRLGELDRLPSGDTMRPFRDAFTGWLASAKTGDYNLSNRQKAGRAFAKLARKDDTLEAAPRVLEEYRAQCVRRGTRTAFRTARAAMQAFLRDTVKKSHRLYREACAVPLITRDEVPPPAEPNFHPLTPSQVQALADKLTAAGYPHHGAHAWSMYVTGMGPGEYWGKWSVQADRTAIYGTKRRGRNRVVPRLDRVPTAPTTQYRAFQDALLEVDGVVTPYDLRRSYANAMVEARIPPNRREHYLGHGPKTITELYERPDVELFLLEDGAKLDDYIAEDLAKAPAKAPRQKSHDIPHDTAPEGAAA